MKSDGLGEGLSGRVHGGKLSDLGAYVGRCCRIGATPAPRRSLADGRRTELRHPDGFGVVLDLGLAAGAERTSAFGEGDWLSCTSFSLMLM